MNRLAPAPPRSATNFLAWRLALPVATLVATLALSCASFAQSAYPTRPVRFIVPSSSGGGTDILTRALGMSGSKRSPVLPDIPTIAEAGVPGYDVMQWYGVLAPAGTPRDIVLRLQSEIARILELPDVKERLAADGAEAVGSTPEAFAVLIKSELARWAMVAKNAGIQPE